MSEEKEIQVVEVIDLTTAAELAGNVVKDCNYSFEVTGKPIPLQRHRYFRGGWANPQKKDNLPLYVAKIHQQLPETQDAVLFGKGIPVSINVKFYLARPMSDFKGGNRAVGNLKSSASVGKAPVKTPDIDNLLKFLLDACSKVIYHDDYQVVQVTAVKLYDNNGTCEGRTVVDVKNYISQGRV